MKCSVAVVGAGSIGMRHLNLLKQMEGVTPIAVPKRKERLKELQSQDFETAVSLKEAAEKGARLVIIASNTGQHTEDALEAIDCGMDLLVEKPLSVDVVGATLINEAVQKRDRKLFVACVLRCSSSLQTFRKWLPKIGKVYAVQIECQSFLPDWRPSRPYQESYSARLAEGGVLRDLIHEIDYALWIFGEARHVRGRFKNTGLLSIASEDFAQLWWETKEDVSVSVCLDYLSRVPRRRMTAFGEKGNLEWDGIARRTRLDYPHHCEDSVEKENKEAIYLTQLKEWLKICLTSASNIFLASGWDGIQALAICDAARKNCV